MKDSENTNQNKNDGPAHCGSKPKKIAIGIAPLGYISIGIAVSYTHLTLPTSDLV